MSVNILLFVDPHVHVRVSPTRNVGDGSLTSVFVYIGTEMSMWGRDARTFRRIAAAMTQAAEHLDAVHVEPDLARFHDGGGPA